MAVHRARRLPRQPGPAAWNLILPERRPCPLLEGSATADVAIVGAGFAGLSAARRITLNDPNLRVAVLEASHVADGPAGRNSGFMIDLPHDLSSESYAGDGADSDRNEIRLNRLAIAFAADFARETQLPGEVFDPCGKVNAAATPAGDALNRRYAGHLSEIGEDSTLLDARQMHELTGSRYYICGLHTPGTVMIQPAAYIRALADSLGSNAAIYENSPVNELRRNGAGWQVKTPQGCITAPRVIMANNGHLESFGFLRRRLIHAFTYASMTQALSEDATKALGGQPRWAITPADPMGTTVRRIAGTGGERIVVRSRFTYDPSMEASQARVAAAGEVHDRKFRERFPQLDGVAMEYRWAGHLCLSWNGVHAFGELEPGLISACCQNGLGTVKGTLAGIAAADLATERHSEPVAALSAEAEPRHLPPEPLAWLGINAVMRWKEWKAGRE